MTYEQIKTPEELLDWMKNITYGYKGKIKYHKEHEDDFNEAWFDEYLLSEPYDIINYKIGNCWDQTELERYWFKTNNYEFITIFEMVLLPYENPYPTHTFLIYKDKDNEWNWFENSDYQNRGIHKFKSLNELFNYQLTKYKEFLNSFSITEEELTKIVIKEYEKPKIDCTAEEFIEHVINSKDYKGE